MSSYLKITAIGHVGRADEVKTLASGKAVLRFSLACSIGWGEKKDTQWLECSIFGDRATKLCQFITKGKPLMIHGEPKVRQYTSKAGTAGASLDVVVDDVVLLGSKDSAPANDAPPTDDGPNF